MQCNYIKAFVTNLFLQSTRIRFRMLLRCLQFSLVSPDLKVRIACTLSGKELEAEVRRDRET